MSGGSIVSTCKVATLGLALALLALPGCSSEDPAKPDNPGIVLPETPDDLMAEFEQAYAAMNITEYEQLLHDDFKFIFDDDEIWERAQDLQSTTNMFAGEPGYSEHGEIFLGVQSISMITFNQISPWETMDPTHPQFPNADQGLFDVLIVFFLEGGEHTITVRSEQLFFTIEDDEELDDGTTRRRFFLVGQKDLGPSRTGSDSASWGGVKYLYR